MVFTDIGNLISGEMTASDFFASILAAVEVLGLNAFNMPIEMPILSLLYKGRS
jgi:hypothetical protein